jgi:CRISPR/Cas system-associated exonuclease Cas4 (RecB family)
MSTEIKKERLTLNREAAHLQCRLDEIEARLRELWREQRNASMEVITAYENPTKSKEIG